MRTAVPKPRQGRRLAEEGCLRLRGLGALLLPGDFHLLSVKGMQLFLGLADQLLADPLLAR